MFDLEKFDRDGIQIFDPVPWIDGYVDFLKSKPRYPGHVKAMPAAGAECNSMADVLEAPYFLAFAKSFTQAASSYFRDKAVLWSLNTYYTGPSSANVSYTMDLHRDSEADRLFVLFLFGTDVGEDGAHVYLKGTHRLDKNPAAAEAIRVYGPKGTAFVVDTRGVHCGLKPQNPRMISWARWVPGKLPDAFYSERLPLIP
jgi:hypothetical protein